jgi:hypothetical protein
MGVGHPNRRLLRTYESPPHHEFELHWATPLADVNELEALEDAIERAEKNQARRIVEAARENASLPLSEAHVNILLSTFRDIEPIPPTPGSGPVREMVRIVSDYDLDTATHRIQLVSEVDFPESASTTRTLDQVLDLLQEVAAGLAEPERSRIETLIEHYRPSPPESAQVE